MSHYVSIMIMSLFVISTVNAIGYENDLKRVLYCDQKVNKIRNQDQPDETHHFEISSRISTKSKNIVSLKLYFTTNNRYEVSK